MERDDSAKTLADDAATSRDRRVIGLDIDGTIADQVAGIAGWLQERHGFALELEQVTQWDYPIGESHFGIEIDLAYRTREDILLEMPLVPGAIEAVQALASIGHVIAVTSRPHVAHQATQRWLASHGFAIHGFMFGDNGQKSLAGTDVLIDDYHENIAEFVASGGIGVLVDRPWNRAARFGALERTGRLFHAATIAHTPELVRRALAIRDAGRR